jgi:transposase
MLFVAPLTPEEIITLRHMQQRHPIHRARMRAHMILLSHQRQTIAAIATIYSCCRQTVASTLHRWITQGICGLLDKSHTGRPTLLSSQERTETLEKIDKQPRSLKAIIADLAKTCQKSVSLSTLKRLCKQAGLAWKRIRKSLKSKRDDEAFRRAQDQLKQLIEEDEKGTLDLYYFDESGFTLEPCVPYAWQQKGTTIEVPSSKSSRLNVLGFVNRQCDFHSVVFEGSVTSSVVIACIDHFVEAIKKPTTLVIDNASVHTSHEFKDHIDQWAQQGLTILYLPPYSPELNIIEIIWRKIKYEWLSFAAYESFKTLKDTLFDVLANIGKRYLTQFAKC